MSERISSEKNFTVKIAKGWRAGMDPIERERAIGMLLIYIYTLFPNEPLDRYRDARWQREGA